MATKVLLSILSSESPSFLWLVIGFVASFLQRDDEKGRRSAGNCLEGIARLVPTSSKIEFMEREGDDDQGDDHDDGNKGDDGNNDDEDASFWLEVTAMSSNDCEAFTAVLNNGMELNSRDWKDEQVMRREVDSAETAEERIKVQRGLLLRRLGMSMKSGHEGLNHSSLHSLIDASDLDEDPLPAPKRRRAASSKDQEMETPKMALLLMKSMERSASSTSGSGAASHMLPQSLLATDLTFNMFSSNWHVRHGAVLGMLHLLRAFQTASPKKPG